LGQDECTVADHAEVITVESEDVTSVDNNTKLAEGSDYVGKYQCGPVQKDGINER